MPNIPAIGYGSVLTKRPNDGSVVPKHVALNVFLIINWMCLTEQNLNFVYIREHIGMTNVNMIVRLHNLLSYNEGINMRFPSQKHATLKFLTLSVSRTKIS